MHKNKSSHPDLLDILFENRNKAYGAYALRRAYPGHLARALAAGIVLITSGAWLASLHTNEPEATKAGPLIDTVVFAVKPPPRIDPPPPPNHRIPSSTQAPTIRYMVPVVVPDHEIPVRDSLATVEELPPADPGTQDRPGSGTTNDPQLPENASSSTLSAEPAGDVYDKDDVEEAAEFPGGQAALGRFLQQRLGDPAQEDPSRDEGKVKVSVLFVVGKDGDSGGFRIIDGEGTRFGVELVRVLREMPRWKPARRRNQPVAMYFIRPVAFASNGD
jgi:protein TonB